MKLSEQVYSKGFSYHSRAFDRKKIEVQVVVDSRKVSIALKTFDSSLPRHEVGPVTGRLRTANLKPESRQVSKSCYEMKRKQINFSISS